MSVISRFSFFRRICSSTAKYPFLGIIRGVVLVAMALVILTPPAQADRGMRTLKRGDYQTALNIWIPVAEQGSARAQYNIWVLYEKGLGVRREKTQATEWLERAARSGSVIARDRISAREAEVVLKTAKERARLGNAEAMMVIANIYADGVSVTRNLDEAHLWYSRAMRAGHPVAANALLRIEDPMTRGETSKARKAIKKDVGILEQVAYQTHSTPN